jgi:hypothetical protein
VVDVRRKQTTTTWQVSLQALLCGPLVCGLSWHAFPPQGNCKVPGALSFAEQHPAGPLLSGQAPVTRLAVLLGRRYYAPDILRPGQYNTMVRLQLRRLTCVSVFRGSRVPPHRPDLPRCLSCSTVVNPAHGVERAVLKLLLELP